MPPDMQIVCTAPTMNYFREIWYPQISDRMIHDAWLEQGVKEFEERLQEKKRNDGAPTQSSAG